MVMLKVFTKSIVSVVVTGFIYFEHASSRHFNIKELNFK